MVHYLGRPRRTVRVGEIQAGELGPDPSESVWLEFQSIITWPQRFPVLLRLLTISMWLQHLHPISYMGRIATARNSSTSPAPSPLSWDQYWLRGEGEKSRHWLRKRAPMYSNVLRSNKEGCLIQPVTFLQLPAEQLKHQRFRLNDPAGQRAQE